MRFCARTFEAFATAVCGLFLFAGQVSAAGGITVLPDSSTIWQIVNFLLLVAILNFILYRPIRNVIAHRKERMEDFKHNIDTFKRDVAEKENAIAEGMRRAREEGLKEKNSLIEEATAEEKKLIESIYQQSQKTLAETREKIAGDVEKVAGELQKEIDEFAAQIGSKILGRDVA